MEESLTETKLIYQKNHTDAERFERMPSAKKIIPLTETMLKQEMEAVNGETKLDPSRFIKLCIDLSESHAWNLKIEEINGILCASFTGAACFYPTEFVSLQAFSNYCMIYNSPQTGELILAAAYLETAPENSIF